MGRRAWILASSALALVTLAPRAAHADDKLLAEELFHQAKTEMAAKNYGKACGLFQSSLNADFALGTLLNLASCHEQAGKLASAWSEYRMLEDRANQTTPPQLDRVKFAHDKAEAIRPKLARVRIVLSPAAKELVGLSVKIDGTNAPAELFDAGIPIDTGKHTVIASAAQHEDWTQNVSVDADKQKLEVTIPALAATKVEAPPVAPPPPPVTPPPPEPAKADHRTVGYVVGGIGAAALATGLVFGLLAIGPANDAKDCSGDGCPGNSDQLRKAQDGYDKANTFGWVSNIALIAGAVGVGVGTVLVLTSGSGADKKTARLVVAPNGAGIGGSW